MGKSSYKAIGGFDVATPQAIDSRLILTKKERDAVDPTRMPDGYLTIGADADEVTNEQEIYRYTKVNDAEGNPKNKWDPMATQEYTDKSVCVRAAKIPGTEDEYIGIINWNSTSHGKTSADDEELSIEE